MTGRFVFVSFVWGSMVEDGKRAALSDALVVFLGVGADDFRFFHFNAEVLPDKVHRREDRQIGIPLAAARTADLRNGI